jgi:hypothetical protein
MYDTVKSLKRVFKPSLRVQEAIKLLESAQNGEILELVSGGASPLKTYFQSRVKILSVVYRPVEKCCRLFTGAFTRSLVVSRFRRDSI